MEGRLDLSLALAYLMTKLSLLTSEDSPDLPHPQLALAYNGDNTSICSVKVSEVSCLGFGARNLGRVSVLPCAGSGPVSLSPCPVVVESIETAPVKWSGRHVVSAQ